MSMKRIYHHIVIGLLFILAGLLLATPMFSDWRANKAAASFGPPSTQIRVSQTKGDKPLVQGKPVHLLVPSLNISLPVIDGYYYSDAKVWTLSLDKAQYATMTAYANNREGNTFIYGHNKAEVFNKLPNIKPGDTAIVYTDNKHKFLYELKEIKAVKPDDTSVFDYQGPPVLTLQTCTGVWYQNRSLYMFSLVKVT